MEAAIYLGIFGNLNAKVIVPNQSTLTNKYQ